MYDSSFRAQAKRALVSEIGLNAFSLGGVELDRLGVDLHSVDDWDSKVIPSGNLPLSECKWEIAANATTKLMKVDDTCGAIEQP